MVDSLEFEIKKLIEVLIVKRQKRNRGKSLNLLGEEDNGPQLFLLLYVHVARKFAIPKKMEKKQYKKDIEKRKKKNKKKDI